MTRRTLACLLIVAPLLGACRQPPPPAREYELTGVVLAVRPERREIVVRHEDIKGFMPGMTMPFKVKDAGLLSAARPGDVVTATLVVEDVDAWLSRVSPTGRREALPDSPAPAVKDPPLTAGEQVPDATFTDQDGKPLPIRSLRGKPWACTFVYTRCPLPTFCPALDQRFQAVQRGIAADRALAGTQLVTITIDPDHDTPAVLRTHAARLQADPAVWRFAMGEREAIDRFGERFGLTVQRGSGTPDDLVHSLRTAVVDADGRLVRVFEGTEWAAAEVLSALRGLAR